MCTSIRLKTRHATVLAQNYDFYYGHGLVIANRRGVLKTALTDDLTWENAFGDENSSVEWRSRHGSVTFNQFARELPICGMNEAGLAIVSMWHNEGQKPSATGKDQITELQWTQMQLDLHSTIDEVVENLNSISYYVQMYPMRYHVSDKTGTSAIIEYKNDRLRALTGPHISACGNEGFERSLTYSQKFSSIDPRDITIKDPLLDRAAKAILLSRKFNDEATPGDIQAAAFEILDSVRLQAGFGDLFRWLGKGIPPSQTFLQVVLDITRRKILFRVKGKENLSEIALDQFDFSKTSPLKVFDMEKGEEGDIATLFHNYTRADNERLVKKSFAPVKMDFPENVQQELITYPEVFR